MTLVLRGRVLAAVVAAFALAGTTGANAAIITSHDDQGRTIHDGERLPPHSGLQLARKKHVGRTA